MSSVLFDAGGGRMYEIRVVEQSPGIWVDTVTEFRYPGPEKVPWRDRGSPCMSELIALMNGLLNVYAAVHGTDAVKASAASSREGMSA
jgi:hypothetical protein